MLKGLAILPTLLFAVAPLRGAMPFDNGDKYILSDREGENAGYCLDRVSDDYLNEVELRVYYDEDKPIKEIASGAFDNCVDLETIVISRYVEVIPKDIFTNLPNLKNVFYTGSEEEFDKFELDVGNCYVNYYQKDEGFLCFWFDYIRPTPDANICDIPDSIYHGLLSLYNELSDEERQVVNRYEDAGDLIINSISYLKKMKTVELPPETKPDADKTTMIAFILIIASVGMSFICIFYLLKETKVIN